MRMLRTLCAAILAAALPCLAAAQTNPNLAERQVLSAGQWNNLFASKQDTLGFTPMNVAGGVFLGRVVTAPPGASTAGLNLTPGTTPGSPANGDLWVTSSGLFAQVNGVTIGPLSGATSTSFGNTSPITVSFPLGVVTYACATCGVTGSPLSQFASTTSAQLAGIISDETGTGALVFAGSPTLTGTITAAAATFSGSATFNSTFKIGAVTETFPTSGLLVGTTDTQTLSSKTLTASSNVLGGVAMTLGSDANGDMYCRSGGVLTRIGAGASAALLTSGGAGVCPTWVAAPGGGNVSNSGTPVVNQVAQWINSTQVAGVNLNTLLSAGNFIAITGTTTPTIAVNAAAKSDQQAGTSNVLAVAPLHQQDHDSAVKAWATFNAAGTILASYNVSAVTKNSTGNWTATINPTAFASANFSCTVTSASSGPLNANIVAKTATTVNIETYNQVPASIDPSVSVDFHCTGRQ